MRIASPLAAAAAIAIVLFVSLSPGGGSIAFAQVQERLAEVETVAFRVTMTGFGEVLTTGRVQIKEGRGSRMVFDGPEGETVMITGFTDRRELTLLPGGQATLVDIGDDPEMLPLNAVEQLRRLEGWDAEPVGREVVSGRTVVHYRFADEETAAYGEVWVDEATRLPVRTRFGIEQASGGEVTTEMTDYVWDLPLDDGLFDLQVPEGYSLVEGNGVGNVASVLKAADEASFVRLLNLWADLAGGAFPDSMLDVSSASASVTELIQAPEGLERLRAWAAKSLGVDEVTPAQFDDYLASGFAQDMSGGTVFLATTATPLGIEWHGQGAELGQADRVICFWRDGHLDDHGVVIPGEGYRVVYGDLRIETQPDAPVLP